MVDKKLVTRMVFAGCTNAQIAHRVGVSKQAVHQLLNRMRTADPSIPAKVKRPPIPPRPDYLSVQAYIMRMRASGYPIHLIGKETKLSHAKVTKMIEADDDGWGALHLKIKQPPADYPEPSLINRVHALRTHTPQFTYAQIGNILDISPQYAYQIDPTVKWR